MNAPVDVSCILEAVLLTSAEPVALRALRSLWGDALDAAALRAHLLELQARWQGRGIELVELASGWRFQTRAAVQPWLDLLHPEKPARYARVTLETLAIVAYRQPVTRGDIEDIRGVTVNANAIKQLEDRGWIEIVGHRDTVGRPALWATTRRFLDDLGLRSLADLPALQSQAQVLGPAVDDRQLDWVADAVQNLSLDAPALPTAAGPSPPAAAPRPTPPSVPPTAQTPAEPPIETRP